MKVNQTTNERIARVIAGLALLKSAKSAKLKMLGLVPLITGTTGYCPAKSKLLGINEVKGKKCCAKEDKQQAEKNNAEKKQAEKANEAATA